MADRIRVYIAGPITKGDLQTNVNNARQTGMRLLKAGFAPMVPHLTCFMGGNTPEVLPNGTVHEDWYAADLPWVAVSDAVLRLPGESTGADLETGLALRLGIPVYYSADELIAQPPARGDDRFHALLRQLGSLHCRKAADYGTDADQFANVRASVEWGIPPWLGALVRANDKVQRLKAYAAKRSLVNESVQDSMMDLAAYALIARILHDEETNAAA